jgi:hypothetical protein
LENSSLAAWISSSEYQILPRPVRMHSAMLGHLSKDWLVRVDHLQGVHCMQGYYKKPRLFRLILSKLWCMNNLCTCSTIVLLQDLMPLVTSKDIRPGTWLTQYYQSWWLGHEITLTAQQNIVGHKKGFQRDHLYFFTQRLKKLDNQPTSWGLILTRA